MKEWTKKQSYRSVYRGGAPSSFIESFPPPFSRTTEPAIFAYYPVCVFSRRGCCCGSLVGKTFAHDFLLLCGILPLNVPLGAILAHAKVTFSSSVGFFFPASNVCSTGRVLLRGGTIGEIEFRKQHRDRSGDLPFVTPVQQLSNNQIPRNEFKTICTVDCEFSAICIISMIHNNLLNLVKTYIINLAHLSIPARAFSQFKNAKNKTINTSRYLTCHYLLPPQVFLRPKLRYSVQSSSWNLFESRCQANLSIFWRGWLAGHSTSANRQLSYIFTKLSLVRNNSFHIGKKRSCQVRGFMERLFGDAPNICGGPADGTGFLEDLVKISGGKVLNYGWESLQIFRRVSG